MGIRGRGLGATGEARNTGGGRTERDPVQREAGGEGELEGGREREKEGWMEGGTTVSSGTSGGGKRG